MKIVISVCLNILITIQCFSQDSIFYQNIEWSPDGEKICIEAITRLSKGIASASYIVNLSDLTIERKIENSFFPSWSADGRFIGYSKSRLPGRGSEIWLTNIITGDSVRLTNDTARNSGVSFSPDGKKICFTSDISGRQSIYIMNLDDRSTEKITSDTFKYYNPVWSPKGDKIVCYRERGDGRDKIFVIKLSDKKIVKVTDDTLHNFYPGWLPDGKRIVYTTLDPSNRNGNSSQTAFIESNGKHKQLIPNTAGAFFARVSPDNKKLAFIKGRWPMSNVYIAGIDGTNPVCITCKLRIH